MLGTLVNGSCRNFQPSLKGRSVRQTASTRVVELSVRYMRPFRTSLTEFYSYGTTVHMSILLQPINARRANHAIFATRACHRIAVPSRALDCSVTSALSRQRQRFQPCKSAAYSPHATRCKLGCEPPRAACTLARQEIELPAFQHALCSCSRTSHATH